MGPGGGLTIFTEQNTLICGCYGQPFLLSGRVPNAPKVCRRVPNAMNGGVTKWIGYVPVKKISQAAS